jgi:putative oxidoreductase
MNLLKSLITLSFAPPLHGLGLLLLRVWLGGCMFYAHGIDKLLNFGKHVDDFKALGFPAILGVAAILTESICSWLLIIGLGTRWAAAFLGTVMAVAFYQVHHAVVVVTDPQKQQSGELAFIYLAGFAALFLTGGGRFSFDAKLSEPE